MASVELAFGLAFDVEKSCDHKSGYKPAEIVFRTGATQLGSLRLLGFAAALESGFVQRLVIVGGTEARYGGQAISRAATIRGMLVEDHGIAAERVDAIASDPHTIGNAQAIKAILDRRSLPASNCAVITSAYHLPRTQMDLLSAGLHALRLLPAEAFWLLHSASIEERRARRMQLALEFGNGPLSERLADELNGIADKLEGTYRDISTTD